MWPRVVSEKVGICGRVQHASSILSEAPPLPHDAAGASLDDARRRPQFVLARGAGVRRHGHVVGEVHAFRAFGASSRLVDDGCPLSCLLALP